MEYGSSMNAMISYNLFGNGDYTSEDHQETRVLIGVDGVGSIVSTSALDIYIDGELIEHCYKFSLDWSRPEPTGRRVHGYLSYVFWKSEFGREDFVLDDRMPRGKNLTVAYGSGDSYQELYRFTDLNWGWRGGALESNRITVVAPFDGDDLDV